MKRQILAAAVAAALLILPAAPASASTTESDTKGCKATLRAGSMVFYTPQPMSPSGVAGYPVEDTRVRVTVVDTAGIAPLKVESFTPGPGIYLRYAYVSDNFFHLPTGYVEPGALQQTKQLEKCLAKRF